MSGNTLGKIFRVTNFGESHGPAIGCVIDGCPPNIELDLSFIQKQLNRRRPGQSRYVSQRQENDQIKILSGLYGGKTTGTPITILIENQDARPKDYQQLEDRFRPGHADYTYWKKYGIRDPLGGGRASARLTAPTVAAGAIAQWILQEKIGLQIMGFVNQIGEIPIRFESEAAIHQNPFFIPNQTQVEEVSSYITALFKAGDSIGAKIQLIARHVPPGLGSPIYHRLDADIAYAMMGLNAVKAVEIGDGLSVVTQKGSEHHDAIYPNGFGSNHCGGVLGGISTGQDILVSLAIKPTPSIRIPQDTITSKGERVSVCTKGRHDPCVGLRAVPVAESLLALVLLDHYLLSLTAKGLS